MSELRFALDTNILVYAEGAIDAEKRERVLDVLDGLARAERVIPTQVLGEFFNVMTRKYRHAGQTVRELIAEWSGSADLQPADFETFEAAFALSIAHGLQIWDALILAAAAEAECSALLSEDLQHGAVYLGVTVISPFAEPIHPLLADALRTR